MDATSQTGKPRRRLPFWIACSAAIIAAFLACRAMVRHRYELERNQWKNAALQELVATGLTNELVLQELDQIKHPTAAVNMGWTGDHVLAMTNGEFLIYEFRHGFDNGFVDHLFLAHGSDGRWWYSTYHFCNGMAGVNRMNPPGSIREFAAQYAVREFDGKSDECLGHTGQ